MGSAIELGRFWHITYVLLVLPSQDLRPGAADVPALEKAPLENKCTFLYSSYECDSKIGR